jgi:hypothetical protein
LEFTSHRIGATIELIDFVMCVKSIIRTSSLAW